MKIACNKTPLEPIYADRPDCLTCALFNKRDICMNALYLRDRALICHSRYVRKVNLPEIFKI